MGHQASEFVRNKIARGCIEALNKSTFPSLTIDNLCEKAGISKKTYYAYFSSKDDFIMNCVYIFEEDFTAKLEDLMKREDNVISFLCEMIKLRLNSLQQSANVYKSILYEYPIITTYLDAKRNSRIDMAEQVMKRGAQQGIFIEGLDYRLCYKFMASSLNFVMDKNVLKDHDLFALMANCVYLMIRGICTEQGIHEIDKVFKLKNIDVPSN